MPIVFGRVPGDELLRRARSAEGAPFTYQAIGATRAEPPGGYRIDRYDTVLGERPVFERAVLGLRTWQAQRGAGVRIVPPDTPIVAGSAFVVVLELPLVTIVAPGRIVYVVDEPRRWGFAYGTLTGHPAEGEESFHVLLGDDDLVRFEVTSFSQLRHPVARSGGPVARALQRAFSRRYLGALRSFVEAGR